MKKKRECGSPHSRPLQKLILMTKLTGLFLLIFTLQISASVYSQTSRLSLNLSKSTIKEVLRQIEDQTEFRFIYENDKIDLNKEVSVRANNEKVEEILVDLFKGQPVSYTVTENKMILIRPGQTNIDGQQSKDITGRVTDSSGQPLPGVSIAIKGTATGTISDFEGNFTLKNVPLDASLLFSFVGMKQQELPVASQKNFNIEMVEDAIGLEEVVAVGYGTMKKTDLTGAVSSVKGEMLQKNSVPTLDQALGGKLAGVYVTTNSGTPGGGSSIRIRGAGSILDSEPLYIIDGIPYNVSESEFRSPLSSINQNDIENIEVLKDASAAAIYGARGANGVVLITTKQGSSGKGKISYSGSYGIQNMPDQLEVMNASEYASYRNHADGQIIFANPELLGEGTNWIDVIRNRNAPTQTHQLSFSGGNQNASNYVSLGYTNTEGTLKWASFERFSLRSNNERKLNDKITVGTNSSIVYSKQRTNNNNRSHENSFFPRAFWTPSTIDAYDQNGNLAPIPAESFYTNFFHPAWVGQYEGNSNETTEIISSVYGSWNILKPLTYKTRISYHYNGSLDYNALPITDLGVHTQSTYDLTRNSGRSHGYVYENTLHYDETFGKSKLTLLAGMSIEANNYEAFNSFSSYLDEGLGTTNMGAYIFEFSNNIQENRMLSYFGRAFYSYDDKYLLTAILRYDGSSRLGKNDRTDVFPSLSGAWKVSNENFFPKTGLISSLKLRAGWGQIGNENIGNYKYASALGSEYYYPLGNQDGVVSTGTALSQIPNAFLTWETATTSYVGMDLILLDGKLEVYADYYANSRDEMLMNVPVSAVTGQSINNNLAVAAQNAGALKNKGFEFSADYKGDLGPVKFSVNANLTTIKNEITDLGSADELQGYQYANVVWTQSKVGTGLGEFYGYIWDGVFQNQAEVAAHAIQSGAAPGDFIFRDISGPNGTSDGVINSYDQTSIGKPTPDFIYGLNAEFNYKKIDFSMQFSGAQGNDILNISKQVLMDGSRRTANKLKEFTNYWNGEGSTDLYPRATTTDPNTNRRNSSYFVENGSYLKCKLIQLGYSLPSSFTNRLNIGNLRVYASLQNAFTITGYSGPDPEVGNQHGESMRAGIDMFLYPVPRTLLFGVNIDF